MGILYGDNPQSITRLAKLTFWLHIPEVIFENGLWKVWPKCRFYQNLETFWYSHMFKLLVILFKFKDKKMAEQFQRNYYSISSQLKVYCRKSVLKNPEKFTVRHRARVSF